MGLVAARFVHHTARLARGVFLLIRVRRQGAAKLGFVSLKSSSASHSFELLEDAVRWAPRSRLGAGMFERLEAERREAV